MNNTLRQIYNKESTLASRQLESIDYRDCFELNTNIDSIDEFTKEYFLAQPTWLRIVSISVIQQKSIINVLNHTTFDKNNRIGQWRVYDRDEDEIIFGQDMGFMEYCFSFKKHDEQTIRASTTVQYKGRFGKYYFAIVSLLHKLFVKMSLKNTIRRLNEK